MSSLKSLSLPIAGVRDRGDGGVRGLGGAQPHQEDRRALVLGAPPVYRTPHQSCIYGYIYVCIYISISISICLCIYVYIHMFTCMNIYIYIEYKIYIYIKKNIYI